MGADDIMKCDKVSLAANNDFHFGMFFFFIWMPIKEINIWECSEWALELIFSLCLCLTFERELLKQALQKFGFLLISHILDFLLRTVRIIQIEIPILSSTSPEKNVRFFLAGEENILTDVEKLLISSLRLWLPCQPMYCNRVWKPSKNRLRWYDDKNGKNDIPFLKHSVGTDLMKNMINLRTLTTFNLFVLSVLCSAALLDATGALIAMMCYYISARPLFQIFTSSIDAIHCLFLVYIFVFVFVFVGVFVFLWRRNNEAKVNLSWEQIIDN